MGRGRRGAARDGSPTADDRVCTGCGRSFTWRPSLADVWDEVRWCSAACRRRGLRPIDAELEAAILELLDARPNGATICPSEAARHVAPDAGPEALRRLNEPARRAARRLVASGAVEILQQGRAVDPSTAKGPVRVRRVRSVG